MTGDESAGTGNRAQKGPQPGQAGTAKEHINDANAEPTKDFFISVITRDIGLTRAILDLVDNSVDGAKRLRGEPTGSAKNQAKTYHGLSISIAITKEGFEIRDNCGGIPLDVARKYAFRFGRDANAPPLPNSIGQFGIGMKRALFKLGDHFRIESTTTESHFVIDQLVSKWKKAEGWQFDFDSFDEKKHREKDVGTVISVDSLHDTVRNDFVRENFLNGLIAELQDALQTPIASGLLATVNKMQIKPEPAELLVSEDIKPLAHTDTYKADGKPDVYVRTFAGIYEGSLERAGWYVFCNGRLVLSADQTALTGWGLKSPVSVPKFHNQFHRFRGYVYFDSSDASQLPWNTTKTGVDQDLPLFREVRSKMVERMKPVIEFLNAARKEEASKPKLGPIGKAIEAAKPSPLSALPTSDVFVWPKVDDSAAGPKMVRIKYERKEADVEAAKAFFRVGTPDQVGVKTFEYWKRAEG